jgi:EAL domain-containing protein (putative c-di-GMP-specific phosphodiesterase class I)
MARISGSLSIASDAAAAPCAPPGSRALLAEDDPMLVRAYGQTLEQAGFVVDRAETGEEAVNHLLANTYDVVVTDIGLPSVDGIGVVQAARRSDPDVPVVLLSGARPLDSAITAADRTAFRSLLKPVSLTELAEAAVRSARTHRILVLRRMALDLASAAWSPAEDRRSLREIFERAMETVWIAYQPVCSWKHQQAFGLEALLRSAEPTMANPCVFLSAAERLGRMAELGRIVRDRVAAELPSAPAPLVFVNLHITDLLDEHLYDLDSALAKVANRVILEVSERAVLGSIPDLEGRIARLRHLGFRIALDNLGTGDFDLRAFTILKPDIVKYDMSLVRGIDSSPTRRKVISAMTRLFSELDVKVIAEGVETDSERATLALLGIELMQGFLFARPAPMSESVDSRGVVRRLPS